MSKKEIVVGTHKHHTTHDGKWRQTSSNWNGTNEWDQLIRENGLENIQLEVVLRPKEKEKCQQ